MFEFRQLQIICIAACFGMVSSSCAMKDLKKDLDEVRHDYGYLKGQATSSDASSNILVALVKNDGAERLITNIRTVRPGEPFYVLVSHQEYTVLAFSDINGDLVYQPGEPAAMLTDPVINWFTHVENRQRVDPLSLKVQDIELTTTTELTMPLDMSLAAIRRDSKVAQNFLRTVTWDDEAFSDATVELGMWQPGAYQEQVGLGLYVLEPFDSEKDIALLVHGINDSPRVFQTLVSVVPDDHQVLLFHYPSGFPLEYTSYALKELLGELIARFDVQRIDVIAHSMGGLVSKGMIKQSDDLLRGKLDAFISISSPFGGHSAAASGVKWSPVIAPVWWAMAPDSFYLQQIAALDLSKGPQHHLLYSYSHERGGRRENDDGVVTVESQLIQSSAERAIAIYGIADNHVGIVSNSCTLALVPAIFRDVSTRATVSQCQVPAPLNKID